MAVCGYGGMGYRGMGYGGIGVHHLSANRVLSCGMGCRGYENQNSCYDQQHSFFTTSKVKLHGITSYCITSHSSHLTCRLAQGWAPHWSSTLWSPERFKGQTWPCGEANCVLHYREPPQVRQETLLALWLFSLASPLAL